MDTKKAYNTIMDTSKRLTTEFIKSMISYYCFDLFRGNPAPALDSRGQFQGTDLDFCTMYLSLIARNAVININNYKAGTSLSSQVKVINWDAAKRYGNIRGLYSHKDVFAFGVHLQDFTVSKDDVLGQPRKFAVVGYDGQWYEGWRSIEFTPNMKENEFLNAHEIFTDGRIEFQYFVHPKFQNSIYSTQYVLMKLLLDRIKAEYSFLHKEWKRINESIPFPEGEGPQPDTPKFHEKGVSMKFPKHEFLVKVGGDHKFQFDSLPASTESMVDAYKSWKLLRYVLAPQVQFITRMIEYAWVSNEGRAGEVPPKYIPGRWTPQNQKLTPRARNLYHKLEYGNLFDDFVTLYYRQTECSIQVKEGAYQEKTEGQNNQVASTAQNDREVVDLNREYGKLGERVI